MPVTGVLIFESATLWLVRRAPNPSLEPLTLSEAVSWFIRKRGKCLPDLLL
jgi:hypothetical protein